MTTLKVPDMHCNHCVARIETALKAAGIEHSISLEEKTVTVDGCENCVKTAISELDDLGFDAEIIK